MTVNGTINVSVSNHYRTPSFDSEVVTQGILGEHVEILEQGSLFSKVLQQDGYSSWVDSDQLVNHVLSDGKVATVKSHFMPIHAKHSLSSEKVRDGVVGASLHIIDEANGWFKILLPDGLTGWAEKHHFGTFPPFSPKNILSLARQFLGYQYFWGGKTPKGFDCSGFTQLVFGLHNLMLPRDAWQQQKQYQISDAPADAQPADLLFFAKTPDKVTHVAIALGNRRFIHASGWIKYNSLNENDRDFSPEHLKTFVSVNRYH